MQASVIILNWNGWRDTIECLESVFRLRGENFRVVVCDNSSSDGSLEKIRQWAAGELAAKAENPQMGMWTSPPIGKPIPCIVLSREEAETGQVDLQAPLTLIETGGNLGYAGGNNVGLRFALRDAECRYFWLLNNDTVVHGEALQAMIRTMHERPNVGLCGSLTLSYYNPDEVQAQGGHTYRRWSARVKKPPALKVPDLASHPLRRMDYVNGASVLVSREFLETIGLLEESYFLYFEELDWAMRARGTFALGYAPESVIYHKEGASIGTNPDRWKRSMASDRHLARSRILFTRRFFPWALPSVLACITLGAIYRLCGGDFKRSKAMLVSMLQGLRA